VVREIELLDVVTRRVAVDLRAMRATLTAIHAEHRHFLRQMRRIQRSAKTRLSK
jgi:hypothetical protein